MTEHEKESTRCFDGVYSAEEIELNKQLCEACTVDTPDFHIIEDLLKRGADPLGPTELSRWGLLEHVYGDVLCDSHDSNSIHIPRITELFLQYGMDIDCPKIPYDDDDDSLNPMWQFAFVINENSIRALKMLLDKGLSAESVRQMWGHALFDIMLLEDCDPNTDELWHYEWTWLIKAIMLCASYDHVLRNDRDLQELLAVNANRYDLHKFRNWDDFYYAFDLSFRENFPRLESCAVRIFEKATGKEIWDFRV